MAHKLAFALVALFGLVNAGVLAGDGPHLAVGNIIEHPQISGVKTVVVKDRGVVSQ